MAKTRIPSRIKLTKLEQLVARKESAEGVALMDWAGYNERAYPDLAWLFHIPNGGLRDVAVGAQLKREGLKPGVSDYAMLTARRGYFGFVLELKVRPNKPEPDQVAFLNWCRANGYFATWCYGWTRAVDYLAWYCSGSRTNQAARLDPVPNWNTASSAVLGFDLVSTAEPVELHERSTHAELKGRRSRLAGSVN